MNYSSLRKFIRLLLSEKKDLLGEPDMTNAENRKKQKDKKKKKSDEMSVAAGMPGVSTPLGTGPTYPAKIVKKHKKNKK